MAIKEIKKYGDICLRQHCLPIGDFTPSVEELAKNMLQTMYAARGIGLAAPQVGILKRIIVLDVESAIEGEGKFHPIILINPEITDGSGHALAEEGCLSIPGIREEVKRIDKIVVRARNLKGESVKLEPYGLLSRVIQHEIDHLNGVLFIDRLDFFKRLFLRSKLKKIK